MFPGQISFLPVESGTYAGGCQVFVEVGVGGGWRVVNRTIDLRNIDCILK